MFQHGVTKQCSIHPFESSWGLQTGRGTKRPLSELCFSWSYGICHLGHWFCSHHNLEGCVVTVSYLWMGNLISNSGICAASSHVHVVFPCWSSLTPERQKQERKHAEETLVQIMITHFIWPAHTDEQLCSSVAAIEILNVRLNLDLLGAKDSSRTDFELFELGPSP